MGELWTSDLAEVGLTRLQTRQLQRAAAALASAQNEEVEEVEEDRRRAERAELAKRQEAACYFFLAFLRISPGIDCIGRRQTGDPVAAGKCIQCITSIRSKDAMWRGCGPGV